VHSLSGELLRSLKGPSVCIHPRLVNISSEGRILVNYSNETGYMAMFSLNGNLMAHVKLNDQNLVSYYIYTYSQASPLLVALLSSAKVERPSCTQAFIVQI